MMEIRIDLQNQERKEKMSIIEFLEEIMELDEGSLNMDTALDDVEEWDSLTILSLIVEGKKKYGKEITSKDVLQFKTIRDIAGFLEN